MWVETQPSGQSLFQKLNADNGCQKTRKIRYHFFEALLNFVIFLYFVPNNLPRIVILIICLAIIINYYHLVWIHEKNRDHYSANQPASDYMSTSVSRPYKVIQYHYPNYFAETLLGCTCYLVRACHLRAC